jgi:hypothetical protein
MGYRHRRDVRLAGPAGGGAHTHKAIIQHVADMADAGHGEQGHAEISAALGYGIRTVGDALRRARLLGLLEWHAHYEPRPGSVLRWRTANIYRRTMPPPFAVPRPDVRRHDTGTLRRARQEESKRGKIAHERVRDRYSVPELALPAVRAAMERRFAERWQAGRR